MSQFAEIISAQKSLEESFVRKMGELEAQIQGAGPAKDTVAKVADEFRSFRELMFGMLGLLRKQIIECAKQVDGIETRQRRKALVFHGLAEAEKEDVTAVILDVLNKKMALSDVSRSSIKVCHRLGAPSKEHFRPILVRFASDNIKATVWKAKTRLKGSRIAAKEFLTRPRQHVFARARQHFGMRSCWTQDGVIFVRPSDGSRHRLTSIDELSPLLEKYPKASASSPSPNLKGTTRRH